MSKRKYEPWIDEKLGYWMNVNGRVIRILQENGIMTVTDIIRHKREFFGKLPGFGKRSLKQLDDFMERHDFRYGSRKMDYIVHKTYFYTREERHLYWMLEVFGLKYCMENNIITYENMKRLAELEQYQKIDDFRYKKVKSRR